uniref:Lysophosphatidylcholine acyltransferase 4 n=1 Tax=Oreochromis niloticus TaxID=8128 RepID=A0A669EBX9_ORENI
MERIDDGYSATQEYPHPFIHKVKLTRAQRIRGIILGSILFPIRVTLAGVCFLIMWPIARLRLAGLSEEERSKPVEGWRRWFYHPIIWLLSRAVFFSLGFYWVKVKGRRANLKEAPVLVVAPHSGFLDMLVLCPAQLATVVSRSENTSLPVIGALLEFNQSVLVSRKDPESRKKAVAQLNERLTSDGYWPQMLMFPEGTTTNGSALIKFKPGAFLAGVPVQPVLLHYPNKLVSNTVDVVYLFIVLQFLPVYNPSQEEKKDPNLYADNVQKLMARALGVPATDYVMEGGVPVSKVGGLSLPLESPARETVTLLHKSGMIDRCCSGAQGAKVIAEELASILGLSHQQTAAHICSLYSKDHSVDLRHIYFSVAPLTGCVDLKTLLHSAFTMFNREGRGSLSERELSDLMEALLGVPQHRVAELYAAASDRSRLTEESLLRVLTAHPTFQKVTKEYLRPEEAAGTLSNGRYVNNNGSVYSNSKKSE